MTATINTHDEFAVNTGGATGDLIMVRLDPNGEPIKQPFAFEDYDVIEKGMVDFEITGFQVRFEMKRPQRFMVPNPKTGEMPSPTQPKTRLEFTIIDGPQAGKRWLGLYTWAVGEQSTLGMLIRNLTRQPVPRNWRMTDVIGLRGRGYVKHSLDQNGQVKQDRDGNPYPDLSVDTAEPIPAQPSAPAPKKAAPKNAAPEPSETIVAWSEFWTYAKSYGFNPQKGMTAIEAALGEEPGSFEQLPPDEVKRLLAAHVGDDGEAPF